MTAKEYIENEDFEGAYERYQKANKRWLAHWFDVCYEIANEVAEIAKNFIFDPVNKVIKKIGEFVQKAKGRPNKKDETSHVYLIRMFDKDDKEVYTKVGKANNVAVRMKQLEKYIYKNRAAKIPVPIGRVEVVDTWDFPNSKAAESFETKIQSILMGLYELIPNDRFAPIEDMNGVVSMMNTQYSLFNAA